MPYLAKGSRICSALIQSLLWTARAVIKPIGITIATRAYNLLKGYAEVGSNTKEGIYKCIGTNALIN